MQNLSQEGSGEHPGEESKVAAGVDESGVFQGQGGSTAIDGSPKNEENVCRVHIHSNNIRRLDLAAIKNKINLSFIVPKGKKLNAVDYKYDISKTVLAIHDVQKKEMIVKFNYNSIMQPYHTAEHKWGTVADIKFDRPKLTPCLCVITCDGTLIVYQLDF